PSALHQTIVSRVRREPAAIARLLAKRYPETPSISYIPAVSWVNTLRLAELTGDASLETKVQNQIAPWVSGERKLFGDRVQLTAVAGVMVFDAIGASALADEGAKLAAAEKSP